MNQIYSVGEARSKIREIQKNVKNGLLSLMVNRANDDSVVMINTEMMNDILHNLYVTNIVEFDKEQKIYTAYNEIVPNFYGEGESEEEAISNMLSEAISFSAEYSENIETFSRMFTGLQQFVISLVLLNINNPEKIKEILNIV